ncbi:hypothetical protein CYY_003851, partial [Polysphondylium violaceum]
IFKHVHQIQCNHYSLKYDDIVDIGWIHKHNHRGLLTDKLNSSSDNSNNYLFIDGHYLFTTIANSDTELFITLFERFKYQVLGYYYSCQYDDDWSKKLNNIDVVRYLFDRGYGRDIWFIKIERIDINLLKYYLESQWLEPSFCIFTKYQSKLDESTRTSRIDLKDKIELVLKHIESTIDPEKKIIDIANLLYNLKDGPISLIKSFYHLIEKIDVLPQVNKVLQTKYSITLQEVVNFGQTAEDLLASSVNSKNSKNSNNSSNNNKSKNQNNSNYNRSIDQYNFSMRQAFQISQNRFWPTWIDKQGQEFIKGWQVSSSRIKVKNQHIYYSLMDDCMDHQSLMDKELPSDFLNKKYHNLSESFPDITRFICTACKLNTNVQAFRFMYRQGYTAPEVRDHRARGLSYQELTKLTSDQDRDAIVELSNSPNVGRRGNVLSKFEILYYCVLSGHYKNLDYYLGKFKDNINLNERQINRLFSSAPKHLFIIKVLCSHGLRFTGKFNDKRLYNHCWFDKFSKDSLTTAFQVLDKFKKSQEIKRELFDGLILYLIQNNDSLGFKYLLDNNSDIKLDPTNESFCKEFLDCLVSSTNINIIDYINKNKSTCLSSYVNINSFFESIFLKATTQFVFNAPLIEYLVANNLISPDFYRAKINSYRSRARVFSLYHFIYFAHRYKYIDKQTNTSSTTLVEFISRNQRRCNGKLHFKSLYRNDGNSNDDEGGDRKEGPDYFKFKNILVDMTNTFDPIKTTKNVRHDDNDNDNERSNKKQKQ